MHGTSNLPRPSPRDTQPRHPLSQTHSGTPRIISVCLHKSQRGVLGRVPRGCICPYRGTMDMQTKKKHSPQSLSSACVKPSSPSPRVRACAQSEGSPPKGSQPRRPCPRQPQPPVCRRSPWPGGRFTYLILSPGRAGRAEDPSLSPCRRPCLFPVSAWNLRLC